VILNNFTQTRKEESFSFTQNHELLLCNDGIVISKSRFGSVSQINDYNFLNDEK